MKPNQKHEALHQDLVDVLKKHTGELSSAEVLAVASVMVGQIIALQDQRTMSPEKAIEIVMRNIELGNAGVLEQLSRPDGVPH